MKKFFLYPRHYAFFILMSSLVIAALQWKKLKIEFPSLLQTWEREKIKTNPSVSLFRKGRNKKMKKLLWHQPCFYTWLLISK